MANKPKFNFSPSNTKEKAKKGKEKHRKDGKGMSTFMEKLGNHLSKGK